MFNNLKEPGKMYSLKYKSLLCHRNEKRTFQVFGYKLPVCARCAGILAGFLCAIPFLQLSLNIPLSFYLILSAPMSIDGFRQLINHKESNNMRRVITGFLFGFSLMSVSLGGA